MSPSRYEREVDKRLKELYDSLDERDRRRYAAVEACRLRHGGIAFIAEVPIVDLQSTLNRVCWA